MSGFDRRDAAYTQARETLIRRIDDEGISRFPDDERAAEIRRMIAELRELAVRRCRWVCRSARSRRAAQRHR
jgi:hypothetical protein